MPERKIVELSWAEVWSAATNGMLREFNARKRNPTPQGGKTFAQSLGADIAGAIGEAAIAKALNFYWFCGVAGDPDVGGVYEVRTSEVHDHLVLYEKDNPEDTFIAVKIIGKESGCECEILGWLDGRDGKRKEHWQENAKRYYIPAGKLNDFETLAAGNRIGRGL